MRVIEASSWKSDAAVRASREIMKMSRVYADFERACQKFLHDLLLLSEGDRLLIYIDREPGEVVADDIAACAKSLGIAAEILQLRQYSSLPDMIDAMCNTIAAGNYRAVCELSDRYFYPTRVWGQAINKGCRLYSTGSMDTPAFIRCIGEVNHEKLAEFGKLLYGIMMRARRVKLESDSGTRISCRMNTGSLSGRILSRLKLTSMSQVWQPTGALSPDGGATFLGGQLSFLAIPETIEGTAVIDGCIWPPDEVGHLQEPVVLDIKAGQVVRIGGDPVKSRILGEWLEGKERAIEHFCIGFNPGAQISSNIVEAERAYGHMTIGLGMYPFHTDGVISIPKLTINGSVLMDNNTFLHEQLSVLADGLRHVGSS